MTRHRNFGPLVTSVSAFAVPLVVNNVAGLGAELSGGLAIVVTIVIPFALLSGLAGVWSPMSLLQIVLFILLGVTAGIIVDLAWHPLTEKGFERNLRNANSAIPFILSPPFCSHPI